MSASEFNVGYDTTRYKTFLKPTIFQKREDLREESLGMRRQTKDSLKVIRTPHRGEPYQWL
jgi:hypothetical protein